MVIIYSIFVRRLTTIHHLGTTNACTKFHGTSMVVIQFKCKPKWWADQTDLHNIA